VPHVGEADNLRGAQYAGPRPVCGAYGASYLLAYEQPGNKARLVTARVLKVLDEVKV
jgi:hypothetical protein